MGQHAHRRQSGIGMALQFEAISKQRKKARRDVTPEDERRAALTLTTAFLIVASPLRCRSCTHQCVVDRGLLPGDVALQCRCGFLLGIGAHQQGVGDVAQHGVHLGLLTHVRDRRRVGKRGCEGRRKAHFQQDHMVQEDKQMVPIYTCRESLNLPMPCMQHESLPLTHHGSGTPLPDATQAESRDGCVVADEARGRLHAVLPGMVPWAPGLERSLCKGGESTSGYEERGDDEGGPLCKGGEGGQSTYMSRRGERDGKA